MAPLAEGSDGGQSETQNAVRLEVRGLEKAVWMLVAMRETSVADLELAKHKRVRHSFVTSFEVCVTRNSDWLETTLVGVPTPVSVLHTRYISLMS